MFTLSLLFLTSVIIKRKFWHTKISEDEPIILSMLNAHSSVAWSADLYKIWLPRSWLFDSILRLRETEFLPRGKKRFPPSTLLLSLAYATIQNSVWLQFFFSMILLQSGKIYWDRIDHLLAEGTIKLVTGKEECVTLIYGKKPKKYLTKTYRKKKSLALIHWVIEF